MRPRTNASPKTNITPLATATGVIVFVAWMATFSAPRDSIYAPPASPSPIVQRATPDKAADARPGSIPAPRVGQG
jgi:hypothetical protein